MVAELDMLASGFLAALRRATRNLAKPSLQPASTQAGSPSPHKPASQSTSHPEASLADAAAAADAADTLPAAAVTTKPAEEPAENASKPPDSADPAQEPVNSTDSKTAEAMTEGAASSASSTESAAEEVSHPKVEEAMERSDVVDAQTFGRRLIEGLKADGQTAVGWVLQTFPKLLPFVMLSALRLDDDDYKEDGEE